MHGTHRLDKIVHCVLIFEHFDPVALLLLHLLLCVVYFWPAILAFHLWW